MSLFWNMYAYLKTLNTYTYKPGCVVNKAVSFHSSPSVFHLANVPLKSFQPH